MTLDTGLLRMLLCKHVMMSRGLLTTHIPPTHTHPSASSMVLYTLSEKIGSNGASETNNVAWSLHYCSSEQTTYTLRLAHMRTSLDVHGSFIWAIIMNDDSIPFTSHSSVTKNDVKSQSWTSVAYYNQLENANMTNELENHCCWTITSAPQKNVQFSTKALTLWMGRLISALARWAIPTTCHWQRSLTMPPD